MSKMWKDDVNICFHWGLGLSQKMAELDGVSQNIEERALPETFETEPELQTLTLN